MKKLFVYVMSSALLAGTTLSSCTYSGYEGYLGTMAGAEIGGIIGESIGWMNTSRHSGPGNAMLGGIIGTVAGAVIGNAIGNEAAEAKQRERIDRAERRDGRRREHDNRYERDRRYDNSNDNGNYDFGGFQTEGGRDSRDVRTNLKGEENLVISNLHYEDEDGDGRVSRYETINVIYEVTNNSSWPAQVSLITGNNDPHFEYSPVSQATIEPGKSIRYKAKVFCKARLKEAYSNIPVTVRSERLGTVQDNLRIRNSK